ncbi:hypothetical protein COV53_03425 [Candidatus Gottesmanbacteria bacterium CG11_big_fil_rev_8_21_14_0_20_37_11]|uniref:SHS2 domain-containing protein n=3 Tax=Candidatus Gottesmaniibacteriota TaxID=1752720 RepID=A0A2M7RQG1_9BACT|nr:MAG: hypothetical protein AUJ73_05260 [Candidatus Gottesmanbacteria bacterium CG1_02_37_22]PIP32249.1 MAG: hypothetical protein COX23_05605 [Candidatus Gottesmanbacteria bacterium CG23_combo_of_CG06-09_8_20_14_all_37_19]PIR08371.1 MAG: hypothetical protein COV53_03425 [Candidatus Gottesmanbacteria bacterium CG11_big_fil_rev_8_21_14_0_20_37_11]PIZ02315.1 MAG: hypothetical protein COY59_05300 [Candidatus Gottesmanbacteria bacterium CG_4_10_14_0_8_um_filter_37_24]
MSKILLGLDIGTHTIKCVQLSREKEITALLAAGYIPTPISSISSNTQNDEKVIAGSINRLVHDMKVSTTDVVVSLPSSKVITRVVQIPIMSEKELDSSIQWEAEQYIPWQLSQVKIDYDIILRDESAGKMSVLMVAAPIILIEKYMRLITLSGLNPIALEPDILAVTRVISEGFETLPNILVASIGATTTDIALIRDKILIYTKSYPVGGSTLTKAIAEELGFEASQAEEYKKTYGFEEDKLEGKIAKILMPYFTNILNEMEKTITYFKEQYPKEEIKLAVINGGTARIPQLMTLMTKNIGIDSQISNPLSVLSIDPNILPIVSPDSPIYTTAVGLAMKEVE